MADTTTTKFTPAEEAAIKKAVADSQAKARQAEIETEIRNRILDAQRMQPGYTGY